MVVTVILAGCASPEYRFGDTPYSTQTEVIGAVEEFVDSNLAQIVPVGEPVGGQGVVILASEKRFRDRGVMKREEADMVGGEKADLLAKTAFMGHSMMGEAIGRARLFDYFNIVSSDDPATTAALTRGQFVIWYDLRDSSSARWYVRSNVGRTVREVPVDTHEPVGAPRIQKWLQTLNDTLVNLHGSPRPAAHTDG